MQTLLRGLDRLLLGGWLGSWALFGLVITPVVFTKLSGEVAGTVVGPTLAALHLYGAAAGPLLAGISWKLRRPSWLVALPIVLAALCAFSHFWISAEIELVRPSDFNVETTTEDALRFSDLHDWSLRIFMVVSAALVALTFLHATDREREPQ